MRRAGFDVIIQAMQSASALVYGAAALLLLPLWALDQPPPWLLASACYGAVLLLLGGFFVGLWIGRTTYRQWRIGCEVNARERQLAHLPPDVRAAAERQLAELDELLREATKV